MGNRKNYNGTAGGAEKCVHMIRPDFRKIPSYSTSPFPGKPTFVHTYQSAHFRYVTQRRGAANRQYIPRVQRLRTNLVRIPLLFPHFLLQKLLFDPVKPLSLHVQRSGMHFLVVPRVFIYRCHQNANSLYENLNRLAAELCPWNVHLNESSTTETQAMPAPCITTSK